MENSKLAIVFAICLLTMMAVSTVFINQSIFLELSDFFHIDVEFSRVSFSVVSLSYSVAFLLIGPVMDRGNLPLIALGSALILAILLMGTSFVTNYPLFLLCMLPIGFCAALVPAAMFPFIAEKAGTEKKGIYVGSIVASATLGVIWGRVLSGFFTSFIGWHGAYRVISLLMFTCVVLAALSLPRFTPTTAVKSDTLPFDYMNTYSSLLRSKVIVPLLIGGTLFFGFIGIITFLSYRLNEAPFHWSSSEIGWVSCAGITALVAPLSGHLATRLQLEKIVLYGLFGSLVSCLILGWASTTAVVVGGILLLFLSVYICQPLIFMIVGRTVAPDSTGSASSLYIFFCIGGGSLASIVSGPIWTNFGWSGVVAICSASIIISLVLLVQFIFRRPIVQA